MAIRTSPSAPRVRATGKTVRRRRHAGVGSSRGPCARFDL